MEKVKPGSLTEVFSFSRALHLMQYGGEKVRTEESPPSAYIYTRKIDDKYVLIVSFVEDGNRVEEVVESFHSNILFRNFTIYNEAIHG